MSTKTDPSNLLVDDVARLRQVVVRLFRALRQEPDRFSPTQLSVIGTINHHGPIGLRALAAHERLSAPTITKVVARLEQEGLVDRIDDPDDRRVCLVAMSQAGQAFVEASRQVRNKWLASRLAELDPDQRAALAAAVPLLERLVDEPTAGG